MGIFKRGLSRTRQSISGRISQILGNTEIDEDTWDDLEATLIQADLGLETTDTVVDFVKETVTREGITRTNQMNDVLKSSLTALIDPPPPLNITGRELSIILVVGVNGSGKTTSIAKLAHRFKKQGRDVILAAGDTFRAAAIEQLQRWGERAGVPVIANRQGSDPGAVVYDAIQAAQSRGHDLLIIDTAGRLHNNYNLMRELEKIKAVISKAVPDAPHEVLLVLDGTTGQNALKQGQKFAESSNVTGLVITKLDGTSRGGMIFSVFTEIGAPVQFIGLGEGIDDLVPFDVNQFVDSLFDES